MKNHFSPAEALLRGGSLRQTLLQAEAVVLDAEKPEAAFVWLLIGGVVCAACAAVGIGAIFIFVWTPTSPAEPEKLSGNPQDDTKKSRTSNQDLTSTPGRQALTGTSGAFVFALEVATLFSLLAGVLVWTHLYGRTEHAHELSWIVGWAFISVVKFPVISALNYWLGTYWFLPIYLGMTEDEIHQFYQPAPIPVREWLAKYGSDKIKVRDSLQRKLPHILDGIANILIWTYVLKGESASAAAVVVLQCFHRVVLISLVLAAISYFRCGGGWPAWLMSPSWRIRDGDLRFHNSIAVVLGTLWGSLATKFVWMLVLLPLFTHNELPLLLQLCFLPVYVGDAAAEIVGSCYGRWEFEVTGLGDINKKTVEGVAAMFFSTLVANCGAVIAHGFVASADQVAWLIVATLISVVATLMETFSPRSTDNFTIPLSGCAVLFAFGHSGVPGGFLF